MVKCRGVQRNGSKSHTPGGVGRKGRRHTYSGALGETLPMQHHVIVTGCIASSIGTLCAGTHVCMCVCVCVCVCMCVCVHTCACVCV